MKLEEIQEHHCVTAILFAVIIGLVIIVFPISKCAMNQNDINARRAVELKMAEHGIDPWKDKRGEVEPK